MLSGGKIGGSMELFDLKWTAGTAEQNRAFAALGKYVQGLMERNDVEGFQGLMEVENTSAAGTEENGRTKYQISSYERKGKKYYFVQADRQVIKGEKPNVWAKQTTAYIRDTIRKGKDVTFIAADGTSLSITSNTQKKARYRNKNRDTGKTYSDADFALKLRIENHIDEVGKVSVEKGKTVNDRKNHPFAKDGFSYRKAFFRDFDGKYYSVMLSVGKSGEINTLYNVNKIKEEELPKELKGSDTENAVPIANQPLSKIKSQSEADVKKSFSFTDDNETADESSLPNTLAEVYEQQHQADEEIRKNQKALKDYQNSPEMQALLERLGNAKGIEAHKPIIEEMKALEEKAGVAQIKDEIERLKERKQALSAREEEIRRNELLKKVQDSGKNAEDYFRDAAVKEFGYTSYFYDAGYILPNGKMLNFSGEKGKHFGMRGQDHRAIGTIYEGTMGQTAGMNAFINGGNIRIMDEGPGIDLSISRALTDEQEATVRRHILRSGSRGYHVDFTGPDGRTVQTLDYQPGTKAEKILSDIAQTVRQGSAPEQSITAQFHTMYSFSEDEDTAARDHEYMEAVESGDEAKQRKMVKEAAEAAGYTLYGYHGTKLPTLRYDAMGYGSETDYENKRLPFTVFKPGQSGGIYVATNREASEGFARNYRDKHPGTVMSLYVRMENPLVVNEHVWTSVPHYYNIPTPTVMLEAGYPQKDLSTEEISHFAQEHGYDGVIIEGIREGADIQTDDIIPFSPEQLKLADPVVYDDAGNVIPLSERFNKGKEDIRYSITDDEESDKKQHTPVPSGRTKEDVSYETLIKKPDMPITELKELTQEQHAELDTKRGRPFAMAILKHLEEQNGSRDVYNKDMNRDIHVGANSVKHSNKTSNELYTQISLHIKDILGNAVVVNELEVRPEDTGRLDKNNNPKLRENVKGINYTSVLIGAARIGDQIVAVRLLVDNRTQDLEEYDILSAMTGETNKESDDVFPWNHAYGGGNSTSGAPSSDRISIRDLLETVKNLPKISGVISLDVAEHLGITRPYIKGMSEYLKFSMQDGDDTQQGRTAEEAEDEWNLYSDVAGTDDNAYQLINNLIALRTRETENADGRIEHKTGAWKGQIAKQVETIAQQYGNGNKEYVERKLRGMQNKTAGLFSIKQFQRFAGLGGEI